jgi:hypothetical protein
MNPALPWVRLRPFTSLRTDFRPLQGIFEAFKKYAYGMTSLHEDASLWEWLALAQHHG